MLRKVLFLGFVLCVVVLATLLFTGAPIGTWVVNLVEWIASLGIRGGILFALIYMVVTVCLFPQTPLNLAAGFLYGTLWGTVLVALSSTAAATIAFLLSRYVARGFITRKLGRYARFESLDRAIRRHGFKLVFLMRLQPVFVPFAYLNMGLGLTRVRMFDYIAGTLLGTLPGTILYAYAGRAVKDISFLRLHALPSEGGGPGWFLWVGLAAMILFSILLARIAKQSFATALKKEAEERNEVIVASAVKPAIATKLDSELAPTE